MNSPPPSTRRRLLLAALLALAFSCLVAAGYFWTHSTALAVLQSVTGPTLRDQAEAIGRWEPAVIGDDFVDGDGARTPKTSTAHFRLGRSGSLTLQPASQVRFRRRGKGGRAVGLTVEVGEVEVRSNDGTLNLGSEFGELVLEPKSRVRLTRSGGRMVVGVKLGRLRFGSDQRVFGAGRRVTVAVGGLVLSDEEEAQSAQPGGVPAPAASLGPPKRGSGVPYADLVVLAGETFVVHDEAPPTAIGFRFEQTCPGGARLEIGSKWTEGERQAALVLGIGRHEYTLRCLDHPEVVVKKGELRILRDSGTRQLPTFTPTAQVTADGRAYTVLYQARLPSVTIAWPTAPEASGYTLSVDGTVLQTKRPSHTFPSGALTAGKHTATFAANTSPARASRPTTIVIKVDAQAPTGRVAEPATGFSAGTTIPVAGQALPGWTVSVAGAAVEKDAAGRFATKVPVNGPLAIAFSHPTHGMHYYLRRPKGPRNQ